MINSDYIVMDLTPYTSLTTMMILATNDEHGNPYASNVYFKIDDNYNFYYRSKTFREHSKHIRKNKQVAWSIINTEKYTRSDKDKKWLQFQWTAVELTWKEAEKISKEIYGVEKTFVQMLQEWHLIYKCTPTKVKIWDEELYGGQGKVIEF